MNTTFRVQYFPLAGGVVWNTLSVKDAYKLFKEQASSGLNKSVSMEYCDRGATVLYWEK